MQDFRSRKSKVATVPRSESRWIGCWGSMLGVGCSSSWGLSVSASAYCYCYCLLSSRGSTPRPRMARLSSRACSSTTSRSTPRPATAAMAASASVASRSLPSGGPDGGDGGRGGSIILRADPHVDNLTALLRADFQSEERRARPGKAMLRQIGAGQDRAGAGGDVVYRMPEAPEREGELEPSVAYGTSATLLIFPRRRRTMNGAGRTQKERPRGQLSSS